MEKLRRTDDPESLVQAVLDAVREPFLVLDADQRISSASRSFCESFGVDPKACRGAMLSAIDGGRWDIPALSARLQNVIPDGSEMDEFEVELEFPHLGRRTMLLNGRRISYRSGATASILLTFTDITTRRAVEREREALLCAANALAHDKEVLLNEMEHRVANSLQIIASILLLKARGVASEETRQHLTDAHQRVMSVAAVQSHLQVSNGIDMISVGPYLTKLCESLASSMIGDDHAISLKVVSGPGAIGSAQAVSLGLIVTELVINALKYAFPTHRPDAQILVEYESNGPDWLLTVSDNGSGKGSGEGIAPSTGLGTLIVRALVKQLGARMDVSNDASGYTITVSRATFTSSALNAPTSVDEAPASMGAASSPAL